jgi:predicted nicotinamide N-methyase
MPGYLTHQQRVAVDGVDDLLIRSLLDRQQFADPHGEAEAVGIHSATWPLFGLSWPSGVELAGLLARHPVTPGERILEVGCGLGLASLVGHRRGADLTATDIHPLAGEFLAENLRLNHLPPMDYRHSEWDQTQDMAMPLAPPGQAARLRLQGRFDLIIGSDLLYDRDHSLALAGFVGRHAKAKSGIWIVDPDRSNRSPFKRSLLSQGYTLKEHRLDHAGRDGGLAYKGRLLVFQRDA